MYYQLHIFVSFIFTFTAIYVWLWSLTQSGLKTIGRLNIIFIPVTAAIVYALLAVFTYFDTFSSSDLYLFRYFEWLLSTVLMVIVVTKLINADSVKKLNTSKLALADAFMIVFGILSYVTSDLSKVIFFVISSLLFAYIYFSWTKAIRSEKVNLFTKLIFYYTTILWSFYPIVTLISENYFGLIDFQTLSIFISTLDLSSKLIFVLFVLRVSKLFKNAESLELQQSNALKEAYNK